MIDRRCVGLALLAGPLLALGCTTVHARPGTDVEFRNAVVRAHLRTESGPASAAPDASAAWTSLLPTLARDRGAEALLSRLYGQPVTLVVGDAAPPADADAFFVHVREVGSAVRPSGDRDLVCEATIDLRVVGPTRLIRSARGAGSPHLGAIRIVIADWLQRRLRGWVEVSDPRLAIQSRPSRRATRFTIDRLIEQHLATWRPPPGL